MARGGGPPTVGCMNGTQPAQRLAQTGSAASPGPGGARADCQVLIVGAGLAGSALAMHLAEMGEPGVVVVDPDLAGERSSSQLNAGGVRATWWRPVNVELCAATIAFFVPRRRAMRR